MTRAVAGSAIAWTLVVAAVGGEQPPGVMQLLQDSSVRAAVNAAKANEPQTIEDQVRFCEVPAPSLREAARAELLRRAFLQLELQNVRVDRAGNVLGDRPGAAPRPRVIIAAHLDTVFPEETDVKVRREGAILRGPGIGDNCRGLAVLVGIIRAMREANVQTPGSITFVANVGEEGLGDLSGMKELFGVASRAEKRGAGVPAERAEAMAIDRFVAIDGSGLHITHVAVGSHRYRVTFKGPGGHSFGAFGLANPIDALGRAVAKIAEFQVPKQPRTTFNVGRIGGGTSVNSIPFEAWMEVDMRSADPASLASVDANFHKAVDLAVVEENDRWGTPRTITVVKDLVGDRPAGSTPADAPIVRSAQEVGRALGFSVSIGEGSTDSNIPISLKIPAITIGGGGRGSGVHAPSEAFDTTDAWMGTQNAVLVTIAMAQK